MMTNPPQTGFAAEAATAQAASLSTASTGDEWSMRELIERLSAELDAVHRTLTLKAGARDTLYAPSAITFELSVFSRFDTGRGQLLFRSAAPGEIGAGTVRLDLTPLLSEQFTVAEPAAGGGYDAAAIASLPGITPAEVAAFERMGIAEIDEVAAVGTTSATRMRLAAQTAIAFERLAGWFGWPLLRYAVSNGDLVMLIGERFGTADAQSVVLMEGMPAEIVVWGNNMITIRCPLPITAQRLLVITAFNGGSNGVAIASAPPQDTGKPPGGLASDTPAQPGSMPPSPGLASEGRSASESGFTSAGKR